MNDAAGALRATVGSPIVQPWGPWPRSPSARSVVVIGASIAIEVVARLFGW